MIRKALIAASLVLLALAACAPRVVQPAIPEDVEEPAAPAAPVAPAVRADAPVLSLVPDASNVTRFDPPGTGSRVTLLVAVEVQNPNDFGISLRNLDWSADLEGRRVARGTLIVNDSVPAGGSLGLEFELSAPLGQNPDLMRAVAAAFGGRPLAFRIDARVAYQSVALNVFDNVTVVLHGTALATEAVLPPEVSLDTAQSGAFELRPGVPVVRIVLDVDNPGDIGYFLHGKDLALFLNREQIALQDLALTPVRAAGASRVELIFYPDVARLTEAQLAALSDALAGIPVRAIVYGELLMDVLGVDTYVVPGGLDARGTLGTE